MLNLSRRVGESILIGEDIVITILAVQGKQVRIGLSAPEGVVILRDEIAPMMTTISGNGPVIIGELVSDSCNHRRSRDR